MLRRNTRRLLAASILVCSPALALAQQSGVVSAECSRPVIIVRPPEVCETNYAGTLIIDRHEFRILTDCSITDQIERAFEKMDFDASCRDGAVRVSIGRCSPDVRWLDGAYCLKVERWDGRIFARPERRVIIDVPHRAPDHERARRGPRADAGPYHPDRPGAEGGIKAALKIRISTEDRW
jgi:hypothetical protein